MHTYYVPKQVWHHFMTAHPYTTSFEIAIIILVIFKPYFRYSVLKTSVNTASSYRNEEAGKLRRFVFFSQPGSI